MQFSFKRMLLKGVKYTVIFGIPVVVDQFLIALPTIAKLTIGGLLVMLGNFLKVRVNARLP